MCDLLSKIKKSRTTDKAAQGSSARYRSKAISLRLYSSANDTVHHHRNSQLLRWLQSLQGWQDRPLTPSKTTIWSHCAAVLRRCATKREVRPCASVCKACRICFSVRESRALVASSHNRITGFCNKMHYVSASQQMLQSGSHNSRLSVVTRLLTPVTQSVVSTVTIASAVL